MLSGFGVEKAAHGVELAEVKSENLHGYGSLVMVGGTIVTVAAKAAQDHGFESPVLREWLPPAIPWTYMDSLCNGRGVFDCNSGERVARDKDGDWDDLDETRLMSIGIGPLSEIRIRLAGLHGGGLPTTTDDGWEPRYSCS
jgi:hypothetical protein